jgi:serine/threonine protein phosphatase PrpC
MTGFAYAYAYRSSYCLVVQLLVIATCRVGVSSEPQHVQLELTPADKLLILASDGVWEFISSKEAVELVGSCDTPEDGCRLVS